MVDKRRVLMFERVPSSDTPTKCAESQLVNVLTLSRERPDRALDLRSRGVGCRRSRRACAKRASSAGAISLDVSYVGSAISAHTITTSITTARIAPSRTFSVAIARRLRSTSPYRASPTLSQLPTPLRAVLSPAKKRPERHRNRALWTRRGREDGTGGVLGVSHAVRVVTGVVVERMIHEIRL